MAVLTLRHCGQAIVDQICPTVSGLAGIGKTNLNLVQSTLEEVEAEFEQTLDKELPRIRELARIGHFDQAFAAVEELASFTSVAVAGSATGENFQAVEAAIALRESAPPPPRADNLRGRRSPCWGTGVSIGNKGKRAKRHWTEQFGSTILQPVRSQQHIPQVVLAHELS